MPDWEDVKDLYEVDTGPQEEQEQATRPSAPDGKCLRVTLPGVPGFMKRRRLLRMLARKGAYLKAVQCAFAQRMDKSGRGWAAIHGGNCTAELRVTVEVKPPRKGLLPSRWKDSLYQSMLAGFVRPSTEINLDYAVLVICRALCRKPLRLVRRRANVAKIRAEATYSDREGVTIELRKDRQHYNVHMR